MIGANRTAISKRQMLMTSTGAFAFVLAACGRQETAGVGRGMTGVKIVNEKALGILAQS